MVISLYLALIFALVGQIQSSKLFSETLGVQEGPSLDIGEFTLVRAYYFDFEGLTPNVHFLTSLDIGTNLRLSMEYYFLS